MRSLDTHAVLKRVAAGSAMVVVLLAGSRPAWAAGVTWFEDQDGDGISDHVFEDTDKDGDAEAAYVDATQDGKFENAWWDHNNDGIWDVVRYDSDLDGDMDVRYQDTDGDGLIDERWSDFDEDGEVDPGECERLPEPWRPDGPTCGADRMPCDDPHRDFNCPDLPALGISCQSPIATEREGWGRVKALYR